MKQDTRRKLTALIGTLIFHAAIVALLLCVWLMPPISDAVKKAEIADDESDLVLLGSEYVIAGDVDILTDDASSENPASSSTVEEPAPANSGTDLADSGAAGEPTPAISSSQPSPSKEPAKPQPEKPGPSKSDDTSSSSTSKPSQESSEYNANYVNFGSSNSTGAPAGNTGSPGGNSDHGASAGTTGYTLKGRTLISSGTPRGNASGSITVNIKVNPQGEVIDAAIGSVKGPVGSSEAARQSCLEAARASKFSPKDTDSKNQVGTITFNFK